MRFYFVEEKTPQKDQDDTIETKKNQEDYKEVIL